MDCVNRALAKIEAMIADAEAELTRAEKERDEALAMAPAPDDPEDVAYVTELRAETREATEAAKAVCDALNEARHEVFCCQQEPAA